MSHPPTARSAAFADLLKASNKKRNRADALDVSCPRHQAMKGNESVHGLFGGQKMENNTDKGNDSR